MWGGSGAGHPLLILIKSGEGLASCMFKYFISNLKGISQGLRLADLLGSFHRALEERWRPREVKPLPQCHPANYCQNWDSHTTLCSPVTSCPSSQAVSFNPSQSFSVHLLSCVFLHKWRHVGGRVVLQALEGLCPSQGQFSILINIL